MDIDYRKEEEIFKQELDSGKYTIKEYYDPMLQGETNSVEMSQNSEKAYADEKFGRDMEAIDEFLISDMVECIKNLE
jgi:hypothetical protein